MTTSLFSAVTMAPKDPILGVTETYNADTNPRKVNLGVGVYYDDNGKIPLLECVKQAERKLADEAQPRAYLPIDGLAAYDKSVQQLVLGKDSSIIADKHAVTVQALGGTGGLKVGADLLRRVAPDAQIWISDPSWENHRALFEMAGFTVNVYPYYDAQTRGLNFAAMKSAIANIPTGHVIVLHACCHNPTGADLTSEQWNDVIATVKQRGLIPFLDIAYQGFGDGIEPDAHAVRAFATAGVPMLISNSFSKSFSLYGERVGALTVIATSADEAARVLSQLKRIVRTNYSNPPTHGGKIVANVLDSAELRALWEKELAGMRDRIRLMRHALVEKLSAQIPGTDFSFVTKQRGMFSYSGLTKAQVDRLRAEFSVYAIDTGRICVAALNTKNIDYVADALAKVVKG